MRDSLIRLCEFPALLLKFGLQSLRLRLLSRRRIRGETTMLVTACPGAGKTALALRILQNECALAPDALMIIVVPTRQLKRQWARAAQWTGLTLTANWNNGAGGLPEDVDGVIVTYAQLARLPEAMRLLCGRFRVLDEIHHGGSGLAWSNGLYEGFEHAAVRLCLSGTPFRADGLRLPFVRYDDNELAVSDVRYSYAQALTDHLVRPAVFFGMGGVFRWRDSRGLHRAAFSDALDSPGMARRLRAAVSARGNWLQSVLKRANEALRDVRLTHPRAKAMVVCLDVAHARAVANFLVVTTGELPTLALSDDPDSADALEAFRGNEAAWLVVCKMAGEGYDCPNLRVCVWATNVLSALFFRQVVGRLIRMATGPSHQDALVFLPANPRLMTLARGFARDDATGGAEADESGETDESGEDDEVKDDDEAADADEAAADSEAATEETCWSGTPGASAGVFVVLSADAEDCEVVTDGGALSPTALRAAREWKAIHPVFDGVPDHSAAEQLARRATGHRDLTVDRHPVSAGDDASSPPFGPNERGVEDSAAVVQETEDAVEHETYDEKMTRLRRACTLLTALLARQMGCTVQEIHRFYRRHLGYAQAEATLAQLEARQRMLQAKVG